MVVLPAGSFIMGSSPEEKSWAASHGGNLPSVADEGPQHSVSLSSFAMGRYDVTRDEYAAFERETGRSASAGCYESSMPKAAKRDKADWKSPGLDQTGRDPVVCVSWDDAQAYVAWLNTKLRKPASANPYRLPSEAEWEYGARAGKSSKFWWGDDDRLALTNSWFKDNSKRRTHPVGSKPGNAFGLYDMVGNVWQWLDDCYTDTYAGAPTDGRPVETGKPCLRVDRGSSWNYPAWLLRSATRERNPPEYRDVIMGFRVARTLP
jgi:formylglycine-generating enzyme required for sulfatase activity